MHWPKGQFFRTSMSSFFIWVVHFVISMLFANTENMTGWSLLCHREKNCFDKTKLWKGQCSNKFTGSNMTTMSNSFWGMYTKSTKSPRECADKDPKWNATQSMALHSNRSPLSPYRLNRKQLWTLTIDLWWNCLNHSMFCQVRKLNALIQEALVMESRIHQMEHISVETQLSTSVTLGMNWEEILWPSALQQASSASSFLSVSFQVSFFVLCLLGKKEQKHTVMWEKLDTFRIFLMKENHLLKMQTKTTCNAQGSICYHALLQPQLCGKWKTHNLVFSSHCFRRQELFWQASENCMKL